MDNFDTLFSKGEYELIVRVTENAKDAKSLFYRIAALSALGRYEDALSVINSHRIILEKEDLALLIKIHIDILEALEKFDEAYDEADYYNNLPYENQEVEEILRDLKKSIRREELQHLKKEEVKPQEVKTLLLSKDSQDVAYGLSIVRNLEVTPYLDAIKNILVSFPSQIIRSVALLTLIEKKYSSPLAYNRLGKQIVVTPSELEELTTFSSGEECLEKINEYLDKDTSLMDNARAILSTYALNIFPDDIDPLDELLIQGVANLAKRYMQMETSLDEAVNKESDEIQKIIDAK